MLHNLIIVGMLKEDEVSGVEFVEENLYELAKKKTAKKSKPNGDKKLPTKRAASVVQSLSNPIPQSRKTKVFLTVNPDISLVKLNIPPVSF